MMSQKEQSTLDRFFKLKSSVSAPSTKVVSSKKKKLNLSLSQSPMKSPKLSSEDCNVPGVIDLISDDENQDGDNLNCSATSTTSNVSNTTLIYSPANTTSPETPQLRSPSKKTYYSPTKRKRVSIKSPSKVKRNLNLSLGSVKDEEFKAKTQGMDDKTIFLMKIVDECLNDKNLRTLMSDASLQLLDKYMQAKPPGQRIVCRLYWQVEQWCKWNKIKKNATGNTGMKEKRGKQKTTSRIKSEVCADDPTIWDALNYLIENGLMTMAQYNGEKHDLNFDEMVNIINDKELKETCKEFKIKPKNKTEGITLLKIYMKQKTNIATYFGSTNDNQSRVMKVLGAKAGACYKLAEQARQTLSELYMLMYLGVSYSIIKDRKLEHMLICHKSGQECYPIGNELLENASVVFKNRLEFERYLTAHSTYGQFLVKPESERCRITESVFGLFKAIENDDMMTYKLLPVWLHRFTPPYIYVKILEEGITDLKRDKTKAALVNDILSALVAQNVFRQHKKAGWIAEKVLILYKFLGDSNQAARVLLEGFNSDLPYDAKQLLYPRALLLLKRKTKKIDDALACTITAFTLTVSNWEKDISSRHIYKVPMDNYGKGKLKFAAVTAEGRSELTAEEYCIHDYIHVKSIYTHGGHWEGRIVTTIFFLLFWDIIYARLRGVRGLFLSLFQSHPLDLYTEGFYANRQHLIEDRLREIEEAMDEEVLTRMQTIWDSRPENEVSGINRSIGWENVSAVVRCLGARRVAALCRRLASHYHYAHSGFPDLTLCNVHTKQITFVEVKTDSDKPSIKQMQWMRYLEDKEINVEFCYIGVHTMRARSRNCGYTEYSDDED